MGGLLSRDSAGRAGDRTALQEEKRSGQGDPGQERNRGGGEGHKDLSGMEDGAGKAWGRLDEEDCGPGEARPLTPQGTAQVLSHVCPSHSWGHTHTRTHRRGMMVTCKVLSPGLGEGTGEHK